ncbi:MAG: ABC transporter ATP-binding protein [Planctomycetota bacterium]
MKRFKEKNDPHPVIRIRNVTRTFREGAVERSVLRNISIDFAPGEIVILLGRSGSGKSTLLNLLGAIDRPSSGEILVQGTDLARLSEHERTLFRRRNVGFIFQFFNLVSTLTVKENLLLPLELNRSLGPEADERAMALLDEVGLGNRADSFPDRLSGGEQQRGAIARALIHDPPILLADEPTGNLDFETGRHIIGLLDDLVRRKGRNLVMATHSRELMGMADRIFTLRHGALVPMEEGIPS